MSVLRQVFGPSKAEVWTQLSNEINGSFQKGDMLHVDKVIAKVNEWTVTLDTYTVSTGKSAVIYTRLRAPYMNKDGFRFKIYNQNFFSSIGKLFGAQDIEIGIPGFDNEFIIKGNNDEKVKALFDNENIRLLIANQPKIHLEVKDDEGWFRASFPEGVDELYFQTVGVIKDIERLKSLFDLFAEVLNQLCVIDSAYEDNPGIQLK